MKEEKIIIFDSGALISFSLNGITDILVGLKKIFPGKFLITNYVKKEVIDNPIKIKKFKLESIKIKKLLEENILEMPESIGITDEEIKKETDEILNITNTCFSGGGKDLDIISSGEASCLSLSKILNKRNIKNLIVIDERTTRILVEKPNELKNFLEKKMHVEISIKKENFKQFKDFKIIRSAELIYVAYKKGILKTKDKEVLDAFLYAVKFKGSAITNEEIEEIKRIG